jgi:hypothetical protein
MAKLDIQKCPETGICSIMNGEGAKIDMISTEVDELRAVAGDPQQLKKLLAQVDASFSEALTEDELDQLSQGIQ